MPIGIIVLTMSAVLTRAALLLPKKLDAAELSQNEFARRLGLNTGVVTRWISGLRRPESHLREAIERLLGVKTTDWMTDDEYLVAFGRARRAA